MRLLPVVVLSALAAGCEPSPPITVVHLGKNPTKKELAGDSVRLRRSSLDAWSGVRAGAHVVRSNEDWQAMWKGAAEQPSLPPVFDPMTEMLVLVATDDQIVSKLSIVRAAETAEKMRVVVRQTMLGEGCVRRREPRTGFDAVITPRIDKPLEFFVEDEDAASCGEPPRAVIGCRIGRSQTWSTKLAAKVGDVVECDESAIAKGRYELVDQVLSLADSPVGSDAKLAFTRGASRGSFVVDAFGTYAVRAEATDDGGRRGVATAFVAASPKKTRDVLVQLTWADVDLGELTAPLPRVVLRVAQDGPRGQRCSSEVPVPGLCDAKTRGSYTYMRIPASRRKLSLSVLYLDERAQAGPSPCVNVWYDGARTASACDHEHRHPEDRWELGVLDNASGKLQAPRPGAR
jgi:hypothetical protein